jgi:Prokaryotic RING finger family 4
VPSHSPLGLYIWLDMDAVRTLLLRRQGLIFLDEDAPLASVTLLHNFGTAVNTLIERQRVLPATAKLTLASRAAIAQLEQHLLPLGYVIRGELHQQLRRLSPAQLAVMGDWIRTTLAAADTLVSGALPTPNHSRERYVHQVLTAMQQCSEQPCLVCGCLQASSALDPCGHLICANCWQAVHPQTCPICDEPIATTPLTPKPSAPLPALPEASPLRVLHLGSNQLFAVQSLVQRLLLRQTPLSSCDRADLQLLLLALPDQVWTWLPQRIPIPTTMALLFGTLLQIQPQAVTLLRPHVQTATDVLRVILVRMGGSTDLGAPVRLRSLPRSLRREILSILEALPPQQLIEDMRRHRDLWKRVGEILHPFEFHRRYPHCALAFAVVRQTAIAANTDQPSALAQTLLTTAAPLGQKLECHQSLCYWR